MHKLPQPVKLQLLGAVLPPRGAAGGALPPVHPGRRRGAGLRRSVDRRRADPAAGRAAGRGGGGVSAAPVEPGQRRDAARLRRGAARAPARARVRAVGRGASAHRRQPPAGVRLRPRGHARRGGRRPAADRPPGRPTTPSTSPTCVLCWTRRGRPTSWTQRSCAAWTTTRARCGSSRARRWVPRGASAGAGATTGWWRRSAVPRRRAWAGPRAWSGSCWRPIAKRWVQRRTPCTWRWPTRRAHARRLRWCGRCGTRASRRRSSRPGARSRASSSTQIASAPARVVIVGDTVELKDMGSGGQTEGVRRRGDAGAPHARRVSRMSPAFDNRFRNAWAGSVRADRVGEQVRVAVEARAESDELKEIRGHVMLTPSRFVSYKREHFDVLFERQGDIDVIDALSGEPLRRHRPASPGAASREGRCDRRGAIVEESDDLEAELTMSYSLSATSRPRSPDPAIKTFLRPMPARQRRSSASRTSSRDV